MLSFDRLNAGDKSIRVTMTQRQTQRAEDRRRDIFESHRHRAFGIAYYMTGNEIEAEEILTNTFITAFSTAEEPGAQEVDGALVGELRARLPLAAPAAPVTREEYAAGSTDLSGRNVRRTDLEEALHILPASERLVFLLHDVEGYKPAAIAPLLQIPEAQVNRSLISARFRIRRALVERQQVQEKAA